MIGVVIVKRRFINLPIFALMALLQTVGELDSIYVQVMNHSAAVLFLVKSVTEAPTRATHLHLYNEYPHPQSHDCPLLCYYLSIPAGVNFFHPKIKEVPHESESGNPVVSGVPSVELEKKIR